MHGHLDGLLEQKRKSLTDNPPIMMYLPMSGTTLIHTMFQFKFIHKYTTLFQTKVSKLLNPFNVGTTTFRTRLFHCAILSPWCGSIHTHQNKLHINNSKFFATSSN
ncbi:hypothetical protein PRUPE_8G019700 [Prunus persica]|uniref:Uncharacterized protein n=1 Tax=Prunus persica TaxID=3760 RepID=A0A251MRG8_PRUPE|nr:hypothetical protein PRUPE_8G019700 [Prunus persica]